ncbi:20S proteasome subunit beta 6, partial [Pancytospora epiphaga]
GFENGVAGIYSFDSIGSYELVSCRCDGSSSKIIQPLLDSWISGKNFQGFQELDFENALGLVKKAFDSAAERDVRTKDYLEIYTVDGEEVTHEFVELRKD